MRGKKGESEEANTMVKWLIGLLILVILVGVIFVVKGKAGGGIAFVKHLINTG